MKAIQVICLAGIFFSIGAAYNAGARYTALSKATGFLQFSLQQNNEITKNKIQSILDGHPGQKLVVDALDFSNEYNTQLHQAYTGSISGWRSFSLMEALFWVFVCLLFIFTFGLYEQQQRNDKKPAE